MESFFIFCQLPNLHYLLTGLATDHFSQSGAHGVFKTINAEKSQYVDEFCAFTHLQLLLTNKEIVQMILKNYTSPAVKSMFALNIFSIASEA